MMGGGTIGSGYPALGGYQQAAVPYPNMGANGQALTLYQQQFAANQQAAQIASRQYYPVIEKYRYGYGKRPYEPSCNVM